MSTPQNIKVFPSHPIVVHCPEFDENSGGAIVLHYLVDRLRAQGVEAYAWPFRGSEDYEKAYGSNLSRWNFKLKVWNKERKKRRKEKLQGLRFFTHPSMDVPIAPAKLLRESIAVYPEITSGNPIGARHVVRWLLHRPDFFGDGLEFNSDEMVFYYQVAFQHNIPWIDPDNMLRIRWVRDDVYFDRKIRNRSGTCRMIRKGHQEGTPDPPEGDDAILLDGKSHQEIAEIFNSTEKFYCHDPYTMYTFYAAVCGCIPIVLPPPHLSIDDWRPLRNRLGIAYGDSDAQILWAQANREKLLENLNEDRAKEKSMVNSFIQKLALRFG